MESKTRTDNSAKNKGGQTTVFARHDLSKVKAAGGNRLPLSISASAVSLVDAEQYMLTCYRYIESNPVTARMLYLALAEDASSRQSCYREQFSNHLSKELVHEIRTALDFSMPLDNDQFRQQIEWALGRSIGQAKHGRPLARPVPECE